MFLLIFESIGTAELVLIGIVALIFLGPRRMPEMARKIGKIMTEFRSTTQDFKSTWEREVNFEEEAKAFNLDVLEEEAERKDNNKRDANESENSIGSPVIKQIDKESFDRIAAESQKEPLQNEDDESAVLEEEIDLSSDKRNWL